MSDPYPIVPKDGLIPVTARRPMPSLPAEAQPAAGAAPHIIYINTIAPPVVAQPPPAVLTQTPVENHYTTHHHTYRTRQTASNSALGMASLALGIIACVICWVPLAGLAAVPIGAIGVVIGVLGVIVSVLFRRSSAGLPFAGVFVCCLAAGISIASTKSLPYWKQQVIKAFPSLANHPQPASHSVIQPTAPANALPPAPSVFDFSPTPAAAPQPSAAPAVVATPAKPASPVKTPPAPPKIDPAITAAMQRLETAERDCATKASLSPEYQNAVQVAAAARARVAELRQSSPGSSELQDASRAMIDADNAISDVVNRASAVDPEVNFARRDLAAAKLAANH